MGFLAAFADNAGVGPARWNGGIDDSGKQISLSRIELAVAEATIDLNGQERPIVIGRLTIESSDQPLDGVRLLDGVGRYSGTLNTDPRVEVATIDIGMPPAQASSLRQALKTMSPGEILEMSVEPNFIGKNICTSGILGFEFRLP